VNAAPVFPLADGPPRSGIVHLRNLVARYFQDFAVPATVAPVGLKYRSFTLNQQQPGNANRVVFIPGTFDGDVKAKRNYGTLSREARNSSYVNNPREIASWDRPITVSIWAAPIPGQRHDEQDSIAVVEDLLEQTVRALQAAGQGSIHFGAVTIPVPGEGIFGEELLLHIVQVGPLLDVTLDVVYAVPAVPGVDFE
jgi:hypothetical protein